MKLKSGLFVSDSGSLIEIVEEDNSSSVIIEVGKFSSSETIFVNKDLVKDS